MPRIALRRLPLFLLAALACVSSPAGAATPDPPTFMLKWGSLGSAIGQFHFPDGIASDEFGNVYVLDSSNDRVQKFDRLGNFITQWGSYGSANGQLNNPSGIAVDLAGNVFVSDGGNGRVQKFTNAGVFVTQWGSLGSGNGQFNGPNAVAVDAAGYGYVVDRLNSRVQKFTSNGAFLARWGGPGAGDGQFQAPAGIAVDPAGTVIVVDQSHARLQKFTAPPALAFVSDVRNDQGRSARLRILRASADTPISGATVTGYAVYRRQDPPPAALGTGAGAGAGVGPLNRASSPAAVALAGWDYVTTVPSRGDAEYSVVVPTGADANATSRAYSAFFVSALTANPHVYFDSQLKSGYSIDNLSPGTPTPFLATYVAGATNLHWGASREADFATYRLYRGSNASFTPAPGNLIASPADTGYVDAGAAGGYYKLAAVDVNGNVSPYALVGPSQTVDAGDARVPLAFALDDVRPNPVRGPLLHARFTLPDDAPAHVELIDVTGRRVAERVVSGAGDHVVGFGHERSVTPAST